jgi:hypothetical protein
MTGAERQRRRRERLRCPRPRCQIRAYLHPDRVPTGEDDADRKANAAQRKMADKLSQDFNAIKFTFSDDEPA